MDANGDWENKGGALLHKWALMQAAHVRGIVDARRARTNCAVHFPMVLRSLLIFVADLFFLPPCARRRPQGLRRTHNRSTINLVIKSSRVCAKSPYKWPPPF